MRVRVCARDTHARSMLRQRPDVPHQLYSSANPLFSKLLNQPVNELRDRCLHLILPACIRGERRGTEGTERRGGMSRAQW